MFGNSPFSQPKPLAPDFGDADVVFVADNFVQQYVGGAELSTEALYRALPAGLKACKVRSSRVDLKLLEKGQDKHWVFFNFSELDRQLIPSVIANMNYSIVEYDFKFCKWRSPEKHETVEASPCDCHEQVHGKMMSAFFHGAKTVFWMSEKQQRIYQDRFEFLSEGNSYVLSSVFDEGFFARIKELRDDDTERNDKWLVLGSPSWIKGRDAAVAYCHDNDLEFEEVWGLEYDQMLQKLRESRGLVFLPPGGDTCPRLVIEAKLLGCELVLNDNVLHKDEEWFDTDDLVETESYLYAARDVFWNAIKHQLNFEPTLSGYMTAYNCEKNGYPWRDTIRSMLGFCDEVCVMDGGSTDGTWEELQEWAQKDTKLKVAQHQVDWDAPDFAVQDGEQKARARDMCEMDFCWQMDADEILPTKFWSGVKRLVKHFPKMVDVMDIPIVEYWGGRDKVRMDINPWKWRLTRNKPNVTHGIPAHLRREDGGRVFAMQGTDGCDYIDRDTGAPLAHYGFYNEQVHNVRIQALMGDEQAKISYEDWYRRVIDSLPTVVHYSWLDIPKKIRFYRDYWSKHWVSLYGSKIEDTVENNMFFDKPWSEVTEEEVEELGARLASEMGGWIFHKKIDWSRPTPWLNIGIDETIEGVEASIAEVVVA